MTFFVKLITTFKCVLTFLFWLHVFCYHGVAEQLLHTTCGTPNYVAPEVLNDKGYDGRAADVWSCGVILYVLLAGFLPFDEPHMSALFRKIQKAEFNYPSWFSAPIRDLIDRILVADPTKRVTVADIMADPWFRGDTDSDAGSVVTKGSSEVSVGVLREHVGAGGHGVMGHACRGIAGACGGRRECSWSQRVGERGSDSWTNACPIHVQCGLMRHFDGCFFAHLHCYVVIRPPVRVLYQPQVPTTSRTLSARTSLWCRAHPPPPRRRPP